MMYSKGFVVSVHDARGKVLRESRSREVFLPFNSEYSIRLRNNNDRRAVADISIDGTDVLGGHQLVIDAHSATDLDRFCIDGDLHKGRRLKFVEAGSSDPHPDVQDPTSPENGAITVTFTLEKEKIAFYSPCHTPASWQPLERFKKGGPRSGGQTYGCDSINMMDASEALSRRLGAEDDCCLSSFADEPAVGATVEGSMSRQAFRVISDMVLESRSETIVLTIRPHERPVRVRDTRRKFCVACGSPGKNSANFCSSCGNEL